MLGMEDFHPLHIQLARYVLRSFSFSLWVSFMCKEPSVLETVARCVCHSFELRIVLFCFKVDVWLMKFKAEDFFFRFVELDALYCLMLIIRVDLITWSDGVLFQKHTLV